MLQFAPVCSHSGSPDCWDSLESQLKCHIVTETDLTLMSGEGLSSMVISLPPLGTMHSIELIERLLCRNTLFQQAVSSLKLEAIGSLFVWFGFCLCFMMYLQYPTESLGYGKHS